MKTILLAVTALLGLAALGGCCAPSGGGAYGAYGAGGSYGAGGAWAGYDGGYDSGARGYDRVTDGYGYHVPPAPCPYGTVPGCYCPPGYR